MALYCKTAFQQFKVGDTLPHIDGNVDAELIRLGYAQKTKPKDGSKTNKATKGSSPDNADGDKGVA